MKAEFSKMMFTSLEHKAFVLREKGRIRKDKFHNQRGRQESLNLERERERERKVSIRFIQHLLMAGEPMQQCLHKTDIHTIWKHNKLELTASKADAMTLHYAV